MKKVFRKIQKGTTKMIERIKSLGEMETKQKCVVQRFEIIIPLHQKITTQYIASASFTCGFFSYRRLKQRFLCYFLCPPSCSLKESRAALAAPPLKSVCKVPSPS